MCPYYSSRELSKKAQIVICNYPYLLDPKVNWLILNNIGSNTICIIDEAHNIDDVCVES